MKRIKYIRTVVILLTSINAFAQSRNYKTKTAKDGRTTVKYELVKEEEGTHFYYVAQTTANITLDELDTYFSNTNNHKKFLKRTPVTQEIKKISGKEWLAYYYFDAPWPMADSDIVIKIDRVKKDDILIFTATAVSNDYKQEDVKRMANYKVVYEFKKVYPDITKITYTADYVPVGYVPNLLAKMWFPEGPANIVNSIGATK